MLANMLYATRTDRMLTVLEVIIFFACFTCVVLGGALWGVPWSLCFPLLLSCAIMIESAFNLVRECVAKRRQCVVEI